MNQNSEQLSSKGAVVVAQDQPLSPSNIYKTLSDILGHENVSQQVLYGRKVIVYETGSRKMRYLGNANKRAGDLDFDIHFGEADFYGDLKASDTGQGRQADGTARAPKFNVDKKALENDNYVVFRYTYTK